MIPGRSRRSARIVAAFVLPLAVATALPAAGSGSNQAATPTPADHELALPRDLPKPVVAGISRLLVGAAAGTASSSSEHSRLFSRLVAAGDLDRDGADDFVDYQFSAAGGPRLLAVRARSGLTGTELWSRTYPIDDSTVSFPLPNVLFDNGPGVLMVTLTVARMPSTPLFDSVRYTQQLSALDGATGAQLWSHSDASTVTNYRPSPLGAAYLTYDDVPLPPQQPLDLVGGRAQDPVVLLVDEDSREGTIRTLTPTVVDGANGQSQELGATLSAPRDDRLDAAVLPRLFGTGRPGLIVGRRDSHGVWTSSLRDTDGRDVWTARAAGLDPVMLSTTADLDGDRVSELLLPGVPGGDGDRVRLHSGASGRLLWELRGRPVDIQPSARDQPRRWAGGAVLSAAEAVVTRTSVALSVAAYDANGRVRWQARPSLKLDPSEHPGAVAYLAGDVTADGADDVVVLLSGYRHGVGRKVATLLDGRTGKQLARGMQPADALVLPTTDRQGRQTGFDAAGTDQVRLSVNDRAAIVSAIDGRSQKVLWERRIPLQPQTSVVDVFNPALQVGACAAVVLEEVHAENVARTVLSNTGTPLWRLTAQHGDKRAASAVTGLGTASTCD